MAEPWGPVSLCSAWLPSVTATAVGALGPGGRFLGVKSHRLSAACWPHPASGGVCPSGACLSSAVGISPGQRGSWTPEAQALPCDTRL